MFLKRRNIVYDFRRLLVGLLIVSFIMNVHKDIAYASKHELQRIHIHVQLHDNADATITEKRQAYLSEGTENYFPIENLS